MPNPFPNKLRQVSKNTKYTHQNTPDSVVYDDGEPRPAYPSPLSSPISPTTTVDVDHEAVNPEVTTLGYEINDGPHAARSSIDTDRAPIRIRSHEVFQTCETPTDIDTVGHVSNDPEARTSSQGSNLSHGNISLSHGALTGVTLNEQRQFTISTHALESDRSMDHDSSSESRGLAFVTTDAAQCPISNEEGRSKLERTWEDAEASMRGVLTTLETETGDDADWSDAGGLLGGTAILEEETAVFPNTSCTIAGSEKEKVPKITLSSKPPDPEEGRLTRQPTEPDVALDLVPELSSSGDAQRHLTETVIDDPGSFFWRWWTWLMASMCLLPIFISILGLKASFQRSLTDAIHPRLPHIPTSKHLCPTHPAIEVILSDVRSIDLAGPLRRVQSSASKTHARYQQGRRLQKSHVVDLGRHLFTFPHLSKKMDHTCALGSKCLHETEQPIAIGAWTPYPLPTRMIPAPSFLSTCSALLCTYLAPTQGIAARVCTTVLSHNTIVQWNSRALQYASNRILSLNQANKQHKRLKKTLAQLYTYSWTTQGWARTALRLYEETVDRSLQDHEQSRRLVLEFDSLRTDLTELTEAVSASNDALDLHVASLAHARCASDFFDVRTDQLQTDFQALQRMLLWNNLTPGGSQSVIRWIYGIEVARRRKHIDWFGFSIR